ncbi:MAG: efflux RND transporter permease subunit [Candidatus Omnitrophica bacterium]|nr:efflux RND transporter permease subunit [Candidatus Omnitrophota bacterium]
MSLPEFAVHKKVTIVMVTLGIVVIGAISFTRLPQELFPPIMFPQITVVTDYANAAPEEMETIVTRPIEEAVGAVSGLKRIESISREGRSTIKVSFNWGQNIDFAALAVREKIDLIKERLPKEAEDPVVLKFDPLSRPIMILSVTGQDMEPVQLKLLAEKMIKDNLEKVEGVASATVSGGADREILVEVDQGRLQAHRLSLLEVIDSIEASNVTYPAGTIKRGLYEYLIRTVGEFRTVKEIGYVVVGSETMEELKRGESSFLEKRPRGPRATVDTEREELQRRFMEKRLILVKDIAQVKDTVADRTSYSRYNGKENISISIQKQASYNTIQVVDHLRKTLEFLREDLESRGLQFKIIYDHSIFIRQSLKNLMDEALQGGFLAFLVLFLFLRAFLPSVVVALSIPVSIMGVFFMMSLSKITINIMSIGGLALAVGMIVDTSIVVLENVFRRRQLGENPNEAAIQGTLEVLWPVVSSNLTSIAVFFPLIIFVPGIPGQLFKDLSWTVIFSQVVSTLVPLTIVTMLSVYLKTKNTEYKPWDWVRFVAGDMLKNPSIKKQNQYLLRIFFIVAILFGVTIILFRGLDREVLPKLDQGEFLVKLDMPVGTRLEVTNRVSQKLEQFFKTIPEIENIAVTVGTERSKEGEVKIETLRQSQALILVNLKSDRKRSSAEVVHELQENIHQVNLEDGLVDFVLQESEFQFAEGGVKPIMVEVKGYDFKVLEKLAEKVKRGLANIEGVANVQDDMGEPTPETKLEIHKERAALYGISALDISLTAKAAIEGVVATEYREKGREYDIRVRLSGKDRDKIENLNNLLLYSQVLDDIVPLKEVATVKKGTGPSEIIRLDQERTITVSADIEKGFKSKDVLEKTQKFLAGMDVPQNYQVVLSGRAREIRESFTLVIFAFVLAVLLVYMIMASQFESFTQPLIIMVTVPLAFFGVSVALWISHTSLNVISLLGIVLLGGVVVSNGIVLIEYINQLRDQGMELVEAAFEAAKVRTRPILMSALTSAAGLIPLAFGLGEGSELRRPMAITVMGGLLTSTFLTLVVIPAIYIVVGRITQHFMFVEADEGENPTT